jgi:hypothetical protein
MMRAVERDSIAVSAPNYKTLTSIMNPLDDILPAPIAKMSTTTLGPSVSFGEIQQPR